MAGGRGVDPESARAFLGLVLLIGLVVASLYLWDWLFGGDERQTDGCTGTRGYEQCRESDPAELGPEG